MVVVLCYTHFHTHFMILAFFLYVAISFPSQPEPSFEQSGNFGSLSLEELYGLQKRQSSSPKAGYFFLGYHICGTFWKTEIIVSLWNKDCKPVFHNPLWWVSAVVRTKLCVHNIDLFLQSPLGNHAITWGSSLCSHKDKLENTLGGLLM